MSDSLTTSFLGAVQASLSVLLVISYGVIAAQFDILDGSSSKKISTLCVRLFLPALLITNVGSQLHADTGVRYVPILIWSLFYSLTSMALGFVVTRLFDLPSWVTPALSFNNTTALPILLIESLQSTGILDTLLLSDTDTSSAALIRAKSYILVNATVGNSLTFSLGPKLLDGEETPEQEQDENYEHANGGTEQTNNRDEEQGNDNDQPDGENPDEQTSLLPNSIIRNVGVAQNVGYTKGKKQLEKLPFWIQSFLHFGYSFLNAPLIGAIIGAFLGLVPPLHKAFFNEPRQGGIFSAWLTDSVRKIGSLFAALQVVVVGVKLSSSLRKMKRGEDSGNVPWIPTVFVLLVRFIIWPAISISFIYLVAAKTEWLSDDPILWFTMMLMPTGPSAMSLIALADVNGGNETEKMSIAKFLCISYVISPIICFAVVGSLKASTAAMPDLT